MSVETSTRRRTALRQWVVGGTLISLTAGLGSLAAMPQALASRQMTTVWAGPGPIFSGFRHAKCVDDSGDSSANDTKIVIGDCNGTAEQDWTEEPDGTFQTNGKCLDIFRDEKTNKAQVELWTCTGGANQQWQAVGSTLVNPVSGKCLDDPRFNVSDGTQLEIYTCNGGRNQQWELP